MADLNRDRPPKLGHRDEDQKRNDVLCDKTSGKIGAVNTDVLAKIQARLNRLERQNRFLIVLLCTVVGVASIAATNHSGSVITAGEIRTAHFTLVDNHGKPLVETQGIDGVEIRSYLPHNVIQR